MMNIAQAAADVAKSSSYVTGQFVIDGVLLIAELKVVELFIGKVRNRGGKELKPGESETCREHGEVIASLVEFRGSAGKSLERIEGKVDRILERTR